MNLVGELRIAISQGVDLNEKDEFGTIALHCAVAEKNMNVVALLLEHGAEVSAQDQDGKTALHYAIEYKLPGVAQALLEKNPKLIDIADRFGNEPLWTAAFNANGNYDLVRLLLGYGANPHHRNKSNLSPSDIPKRKRDDVLLRILESKTIS
jgi:ankyrin repeat protein